MASVVTAFCPGTVSAREPEPSGLQQRINAAAEQAVDKVIAWRRDIHEHPELGNRETRTAALVAEHLRSLGIETRTEVAHTGVVGVLRGNRDKPVIALRADMDALPVTEATGLPFASKVRTEYNGEEVGVMHACGHDCHTAMLMGVAEVLAGMREKLPGTVLFIFQPAEEGSPAGESGGAGLMLREGAFNNPVPDAVLGQHITTDYEAGTIAYRPKGTMASVNGLRIVVRGTQTHGAYPWRGADPIVSAAQIILGLQTIVSRQVDLTTAPAVVTIGMIDGGIRSNIIPAEVTMIGTIRTLDTDMQADIHDRIRTTAEKIAESSGTTAEVTISGSLPVTYNDPALTDRMLPVLEQITGRDGLVLCNPHTGGEDFALYAQRVPGLFVFVGVRPAGSEIVPLHSPKIVVDEAGLVYGVRALAQMAAAYMEGE